MHLALEPETRGLVDAALLARLKPGAMLINTARGEVVDDAALAAAVEEKGLRVGLDVFAARAGGAPPASSAIRSSALPGVYGTHHIGASTDQAQEAIAAETVRIIRTYKETGRGAQRREPGAHARRPRTCWSSATATARACWRTSSSTCARANLNVQETENIVFEGAEAAVARINLDGAPVARAARRDPARQRRRPRPATGRAVTCVRSLSRGAPSMPDHDHCTRIFNFSAGPAVLPAAGARRGAARPRRAARASACRCSRSATARRPSRRSSQGAKPTSARSAAFPTSYKVLFLQGGASLQFSMVPMNLLPAGATADYIVTGVVGAEGGQGSASGSAR